MSTAQKNKARGGTAGERMEEVKVIDKRGSPGPSQKSTLPRLPRGIRRRGSSYEIRYRGPRTAENRRGDFRTTLPSLPAAIAFQKAKRVAWAAAKLGLTEASAPNLHRQKVGDFLLRPLESAWRRREIRGLRQQLVHARQVEKAFGASRVLSVTPASIDKVVAAWREAGTSPKTCNNRLAILAAAYHLAVAQKRMLGSQQPLIEMLPVQNVRRVTFGFDQWEKVLPEIERRCADAFDYYSWIRRSPMRPATVRNLVWDNLDMTDGDRWLYWLDGKDDKNNFDRAVPIEGELKRIVARRISRRILGVPFIFTRFGRKLNTDVLRESVFYPACIDAGIPIRREGGFVPYDAKRNAMKTAIRAGQPLDRAMKDSGHKTTSTFRRYNYDDLAVVEQQREDARRIDAYIEKSAQKARG